MKPNKQQQAILDLVEAQSREQLVDWIRNNALDFAKYSESDCHLSHNSAQAVARESLELLESAIHSLRRYDEAGKRPLGQRMKDPEKQLVFRGNVWDFDNPEVLGEPDCCALCEKEFPEHLQGKVESGRICAACISRSAPNSDFGVNKGTY